MQFSITFIGTKENKQQTSTDFFLDENKQKINENR